MATMKLEVIIDARRSGNGFEVTEGKIRQLDASTGKSTRTVNGLADAFKGADSYAKNFSNSLSTVGKGLAALSVVSGFAIANIFKNAVTAGFEFNATLENSRLGMGAVISSLTQISDASGRMLSGQEKLNAAMTISGRIQSELRVMALKTSAAYEDMVNAMGVALGPALSAKMDLAKGEVQQFVLAVTQMAGAIDQRLLSNGQLNQEIRGILEGDTSKNSRLAQILYGDLRGGEDGVRKRIKDLQQEGKFYEFVMERMKDYTVAGERASKTFSGALSNLKDAVQQALGEGTQGQFGRVTQLMLDLTSKIVTFDAQGKATFNPAFVKSIENTATAFVNLASAIANLSDKLPTFINYIARLAEPDFAKIVIALAGAGVGAAFGHPILGAAVAYGLANAQFVAPAENPNVGYDKLRNNFNAYLMTLGPAERDKARQQYAPGGNFFDPDARFATRWWEGGRGPKFVGPYAPWDPDNPNFVGPRAPAGLGLNVTSKGGASPVDEAAQKAREKATATWKEQLLVLGAQNAELTIQERILRTRSEVSREALETELEITRAVHQAQASVRDIYANTNLTGAQKLEQAVRINDVLEQQIENINAKADQSNVERLNTFIAKGREAGKAWVESAQAETEKINALLGQMRASGQQWLADALEASRAPFERFYSSVGDGLKRAMAGILDGGGLRSAFENFFSSIFSTVGENFAASIDKWMQQLSYMASGQDWMRDSSGAPIRDANGNLIAGGMKDWGTKGKAAQYGLVALQAGAALYGLYTNPAPKRSQNMMSAAMSGGAIGGAVAGAQAGGVTGPWGAVIGAIAGALIGAFMPTEKGKNIRIWGISGGIGITGFDAGSWGVDKLKREITSAINATAKKLDAIFTGLPTAVLESLGKYRPDLSAIDVTGKGDGKNWNEELDDYLKQTLPGRVIAAYNGAFTGLFKFFGVADARMTEFTAYLKTLKTDEAIAALGDFSTVLGGFASLRARWGMGPLATTPPTGGRQRVVNRPDPFDIFREGAYARADAGPMGGFMEITRRVTALYANLDTSSHERQIEQAKQLLTLSDEFFGGMEQYLVRLRDMQRSMNESIDAQIRDIRFDQITDPKQRVEFILAEQRSLQDRLRNATSEDEITSIVQQMQKNAGVLYDLLGRTPEAAAQVTKQLEEMRTIANGRFDALFAKAEEETKKMISLLESIDATLKNATKPATGGNTGGTTGGTDDNVIVPNPDPWVNVTNAVTNTTSAFTTGFSPALEAATSNVVSFAEALARRAPSISDVNEASGMTASGGSVALAGGGAIYGGGQVVVVVESLDVPAPNVTLQLDGDASAVINRAVATSDYNTQRFLADASRRRTVYAKVRGR